MALGRKTGGRQKGVPNKNTTALKDAILAAFDAVGGQKYLMTVAKEQPQVFCTLLGKVIPLTLAGADGGDLTIVVTTGIDRGSPQA